MNELEKAIEQRLADETWERRMASRVIKKTSSRRSALLGAAAALVIGLSLGFFAWQQPGESSYEETVPFVFSDEIVQDESNLDLMASGLVFE